MAAKVLLVEDDNNLREIYEARLMAEGYAIVTAKDGEEALVVAKAELPNLIISDVMMPRISGFEMLDILRNTDSLRNTKVIMLTALGQADDKTRANSLGADRYLVKSQVTLEDIVKAAHELLEGATPEAAAAAAATPAAASPASSNAAAPVATSIPVSAAPESAATAPAPVPVAAAPAAPPSQNVPVNIQPEPAAAPAVAQSGSPAYNPTLGAHPAQTAAPATPADPVVPVAQPVAMPTSVPVAAAPAAGLDTAPSTSDEQANITAQIDSFVRTAQPAVEAEPANANANQDDAVLADAMQDLATNAEEQAADAPAVTPAPDATQPVAPSTPADPPTPPTAISDNVATTARKIIQPLGGSEPKVGIHELLAREEAASDTSTAAPATPTTTFAPTTGQPQMTAAPQPNSVVSGPAPAPQTPTAQPPASAPAPGNTDPNSIAL